MTVTDSETSFEMYAVPPSGEKTVAKAPVPTVHCFVCSPVLAWTTLTVDGWLQQFTM